MSSRSYGQFCAMARALDVIGDRWSCLIVRNLILGPLRWSEMRSTLPGVAKNLLSARLTHLESFGIVLKTEAGYELTPVGRELERPLFALADWGERHAFGAPRPGEHLRVRYFMTSLKRRLNPSTHPGRVHLTVLGPGEAERNPFTIEVGPTPNVVAGHTGTPSTVWEARFPEVVRWIRTGERVGHEACPWLDALPGLLTPMGQGGLTPTAGP